jgi:hypothetical protein
MYFCQVRVLLVGVGDLEVEWTTALVQESALQWETRDMTTVVLMKIYFK